MSEKEKLTYNRMAQDDKKRYKKVINRVKGHLLVLKSVFAAIGSGKNEKRRWLFISNR